MFDDDFPPPEYINLDPRSLDPDDPLWQQFCDEWLDDPLHDPDSN